MHRGEIIPGLFCLQRALHSVLWGFQCGEEMCQQTPKYAPWPHYRRLFPWWRLSRFGVSSARRIIPNVWVCVCPPFRCETLKHPGEFSGWDKAVWLWRERTTHRLHGELVRGHSLLHVGKLHLMVVASFSTLRASIHSSCSNILCICHLAQSQSENQKHPLKIESPRPKHHGHGISVSFFLNLPLLLGYCIE